MSTHRDTRPGAQRAAVPSQPPIEQTPVDVRRPHRLQPGWLEAAQNHREAGSEWLLEQNRDDYMWEWDGAGAMDDDELDDRP
jgi:hypothetical protein